MSDAAEKARRKYERRQEAKGMKRINLRIPAATLKRLDALADGFTGSLGKRRVEALEHLLQCNRNVIAGSGIENG